LIASQAIRSQQINQLGLFRVDSADQVPIRFDQPQ
jgi:hypothetical protein